MKVVALISAALLATVSLTEAKRQTTFKPVYKTSVSDSKLFPVLKDTSGRIVNPNTKEVSLFPRVRRPQRLSSPRSLTRPQFAPSSSKAKRAGQHTLYSSNDMCAYSGTFSDFTCYSDDDCSNFASLQNIESNLDLYFSPNINSEMFQSPSTPLYTCQNSRCNINQLVSAGDVCNPSSPDACEFPTTCSSSVCQVPIAAGCGNCTWDPSACIIGTVCSSQQDVCTDYLSEGDACVFSVSTKETGSWGTYTYWTNRYVACGFDAKSGRVRVPNLECNLDAQVCQRQLNRPAQAGESCLAYAGGTGGCDLGLYCDSQSSVCMPLAQEGDSCYASECDDGLICETITSTCLSPGSVQEGGECMTQWGVFGADDLCGSGLVCTNNKCRPPLGLDDTGCSDGSSRCGPGLVCNAVGDGVCVYAYSVGDNGDCSQTEWDTLSPCSVGLTCQNGKCSAPEPSPCSAGNCRNGDTPGVCGCSGSMAQCQGFPEEVSNMYPVLTECMYAKDFNFDTSLSPVDHPNFNAFLCCMLCNSPADEEYNFLTAYKFGEHIRNKLYGTDGTQLNCQAYETGLVSGRDDNWCYGDADFSIQSAKNLAQCPGSDPYQPLTSLNPRVVELPPGGDPFECGLINCNGNGHCFNNEYPVCYCDEGYWGPACEYNQALRDAERDILREFFVFTNGFSWKNVDGWCITGTDYCDWFGVTCSEYGFVERLELPYNNLMGRIPFSIGNLGHLTHLNLKANFLIGNIPSTLYQVLNMEDLDLSRNYLSGSLAEDIGTWQSLRRLNLAVNKLNGPLPESIGYLQNLEILMVQRNQLNGDLPFSLNMLDSIAKIDMTNNNFTMESDLPMNICPQCDRQMNKCGALGCQNCRDGVLLGCTDPDGFPDRFDMEDPDGPNGEDQYPLFHKCGYYYG